MGTFLAIIILRAAAPAAARWFDVMARNVAIFIGLVAFATAPVWADALANPPRYARQHRVTAAAASASKALDLSPTSPATPAPAILRCQSISIRNEHATDAAYVNLESTTAAATDADLGTNIRVLAGETLVIDGRFANIAYIRGGANDITLRIITTY